MKTRSASSSLMRATCPRVRLFAAEERRKCWGIPITCGMYRPYIMGFRTVAVNRKIAYMMAVHHFCEGGMDFVSREREWADRAKRLVKAELKRADVTYHELAERLREHGLEETEGSISNKLSRGTFPASFVLAVMRAIGREQGH